MYGSGAFNPLAAFDPRSGDGSTQFGAFDLMLSMGVNAGVTQMACKNPNFRWHITSPKDPNSKYAMFNDWRFAGGLALTLGGSYVAAEQKHRSGMETLARACHDGATGLLNSWISTETCRMHAQNMQTHASTASAPQLTSTPEQGVPVGEPVPSANYAYGW